jgi:perosamine synthetase
MKKIDHEGFLIRCTESLKTALLLINDNQHGIVFVLDKKSALIGSLSDGDIRRYLFRGGQLEAAVDQAMNPNPCRVTVTEDFFSYDQLLGAAQASQNILTPVVDSSNKVLRIYVKEDSPNTGSVLKYPVAKVEYHGGEMLNVTKAISSTWISSRGEFIDSCERQLSKLTSSADTLLTSNGTVALQLALKALGIGPGDLVAVPDLTFAATANSVIACGATPVLIDVEPRTWNISLDCLQKSLSKGLKAVISVDLYGNPCDYQGLYEFTRSNSLYLVVDAAESIGATYNGEHIGCQYCDAITFSFFGNKTITCGEGGSVSFACSDTAKQARILRDHGMDPSRRYWHKTVGFNFRMTNLQAAILSAQLEHLVDIVSKKRWIYEQYYSNFSKHEHIGYQCENSVSQSSRWLTTITLDDRNIKALSARLSQGDIETRPIFYPLSVMPPYSHYVLFKDSFSVSLQISKSGISLPSYCSLDQDDIKHISKLVVSCVTE